jgi:Domain of unknown function (DUF4397)
MKTLIPVLIISSLTLTACPQTQPPPKPAQVRFVHASTDAGSVDLSLSTSTPPKLTTAPLTVKTTFPATGYSAQTAGTPTLDVCAAGSAICPIKAASVSLVSDKYQTVLISGSAAGTGATALTATLIPDDNTAPSAATSFKIRSLNANSALSQMDVYVTAPTDPLNSVAPLVVDYKAASTYLEKPNGGYRVRVTAHNSTTPILDTGTQVLNANKVYTFVVVGPTADSVLLTDN